VLAHPGGAVTSLTLLPSGRVVSLGHDGCLREFFLRRSGGGGFVKTLTYSFLGCSVPSFLAFRASEVPRGIARCQAGAAFVGGFQGDRFTVWDVAGARQVASFPAGGARRAHSCAFEPEGRLAFACAAPKALSPQHVALLSHARGYEEGGGLGLDPSRSFGVGFHGRVVPTVASSLLPDGRLLVMTGSEDHNVKLFELAGARTERPGCLPCLGDRKTSSSFAAVATLQPHVAAVRASQLVQSPGADYVLCATAGGKLAATLSAWFPALPAQQGLDTFKLREDVAQDHRAISLDMAAAGRTNPNPKDGAPVDSYFMVAGDSEGYLAAQALTVCCEPRGEGLDPFVELQRRSGGTLNAERSPVLCLKIVTVPGGLLVFAGNTKGNVNVFGVDGAVGELQHLPSLTTQAHDMGVNALDAAPAGPGAVVVVTGGDDQGVSVMRVAFEGAAPSSFEFAVATARFSGRSSSALKGVSVFAASASQFTVFSAGYDQRLSVWDLDLSAEAEPGAGLKAPPPEAGPGLACNLAWKAGRFLDVADVSSMSVARRGEAPGTRDTSAFVVAVAGVGLQLFEVST